MMLLISAFSIIWQGKNKRWADVLLNCGNCISLTEPSNKTGFLGKWQSAKPACARPLGRWGFYPGGERRHSGPCPLHPAQTQPTSWLSLLQSGSVCSLWSSSHLSDDTFNLRTMVTHPVYPVYRVYSQEKHLRGAEYELPASLASSSFGTPLIFVCLTAEHFLLSWDWALNLTQFIILSTIPQEMAWEEKKIRLRRTGELWLKFRGKPAKFIRTCFMNFSLRGQVEPKLFCCSVMFSLVWESKVGFSTRQLTNSHMWFFTCNRRGYVRCNYANW